MTLRAVSAQATVTSYMPGDILFYAELPGDVIDTTISTWTNSKFVHVAIAESAMFKIEALGGGVVRTPIDGRSVAAAYHIHERMQVDANRLANALLWLHGQVGQMYGWGDIANAFLAKFEHGFSVDLGEHFDCSGLADQFGVYAGIPELIGSSPHEETPAQLAQALKVTIGQK